MGTRAGFPDKTDQAFLDTMLKAVNSYRARHGADPLMLDDTLVSYAKSRAALMSTEEALDHGHAGLDPRYGENLAWAAGSKEAPSGAPSSADEWYSEIKDYNFENPDASGPGATGHFTAMVWKATGKVGFGRVSGKGSQWFETYVVATFAEPGNMEGEYRTNVRPAS